MPGKYALRKGLEIRVRSWDGEHLLLDERSGDTHLLGPELIDVLLRLASCRDWHTAAGAGQPPADSGPDILEDGEVVEALLRLDLIEPLDQ